MRKLVYVVFLMFLTAGMAAAQDFPKVEIFGGYSLMKIGGSDINELYDYWETAPDEYSPCTSKWFKTGLNASSTFNLNEFFGIEAAFQYNRGTMFEISYSDSMDDLDFNAKQKASLFSFMAGPRFAFRGNERITPFGHFLLGFTYTSLTPEGSCMQDGSDCFDDLMEEAQIFEDTDTGFTFAAGGGLDVNVTNVFAVRVIQFDYIVSSIEDGAVHNMNFAFGAVFRLGN